LSFARFRHGQHELGTAAQLQTPAIGPARSSDDERPMKTIRFVVIHKPGPAWQSGVPAFGQTGLQQHVDHFRKLLDAGKLTMGGPFMDEASGGMMIPEPSIAEEEMRVFAGDDPAVKSGLLTFSIRPWLSALQK
jgi:uncharacterized protein YciI